MRPNELTDQPGQPRPGIEIDIPGWKRLRLEAVVLDVNGVLALDGELLPMTDARIRGLRALIKIYLLSADSYGGLGAIASNLGVSGTQLRRGEEESEQKAAFVRQLGPERVVAIGNGANDVGMLEAAGLGIAVLGHEGLATPAVLASDLLAASTPEALDLLLHPMRLLATLRH